MTRKDLTMAGVMKLVRKADKKVGKTIYAKVASQKYLFALGILFPILFCFGPWPGHAGMACGWVIAWLLFAATLVYEQTHYVCLVDEYIIIRYWNRYDRIPCKNIERLIVYRNRIGVMFDHGVVFLITPDRHYNTVKVKQISSIRAHWFRYAALGRETIDEQSGDL